MSYVIVDIDGTVADCTERADKYLGGERKDWDAFYEACDRDRPIEKVIRLVRRLSMHYDIIFLTGRRESVRGKTLRWLSSHYMNFPVYFRKDGDVRHDVVVKPERLDAIFASGEGPSRPSDIDFILEDRDSMVAKWRELGYTVLQPAKGDF